MGNSNHPLIRVALSPEGGSGPGDFLFHMVPARGPVTLFAPPNKVTKQRGIPGSAPLPRILVRCPCAARQDRRLRNSRTGFFLSTWLWTVPAERQIPTRCSTVLAEFPAVAALLGVSHGDPTPPLAVREKVFATPSRTGTMHILQDFCENCVSPYIAAAG